MAETSSCFILKKYSSTSSAANAQSTLIGKRPQLPCKPYLTKHKLAQLAQKSSGHVQYQSLTLSWLPHLIHVWFTCLLLTSTCTPARNFKSVTQRIHSIRCPSSSAAWHSNIDISRVTHIPFCQMSQVPENSKCPICQTKPILAFPQLAVCCLTADWGLVAGCPLDPSWGGFPSSSILPLRTISTLFPSTEDFDFPKMFHIFASFPFPTSSSRCKCLCKCFL